MFRWLCFAYLLAVLCGSSCRGDAPPTPAPEDGLPATALRLRAPLPLLAQPDHAASWLRELTAGEQLFPTGHLGSALGTLYRGDTLVRAPWLQVQTRDSLRGWIFADLARFFDPRTDTLALRQWQRRLAHWYLLPDPWATDYENYQQSFTIGVARPADWLTLYRSGQALSEYLRGRAATDPDYAAYLRTAIEHDPAGFLPGYLPVFTPAGELRIWTDWRQWVRLARATPGTVDDELAGLRAEVAGTDSIGYTYNSLQFPVDDQQVHSVLGRGHHLRLLDRVERIARTDTLFAREARILGLDILGDIHRPTTTFWESQARIVAEVDSILGRKYRFLPADSKLALQVRRDQFARADSLGIRVDYRSGKYD